MCLRSKEGSLGDDHHCLQSSTLLVQESRRRRGHGNITTGTAGGVQPAMAQLQVRKQGKRQMHQVFIPAWSGCLRVCHACSPSLQREEQQARPALQPVLVALQGLLLSLLLAAGGRLQLLGPLTHLLAGHRTHPACPEPPAWAVMP